MFNKAILIAILLIIGAQAQHLDSKIAAKFTELSKTFEGRNFAVENTQEDIESFAMGFLEGIGSAKAFEELKTCIKDSEEVEVDVNQAMQLIMTKNPEKVKEGISLLGKAVKIIPVAAHECQASSVDVQKLIALVESFTNPKSFIYYVAKSLLINHVEVIAEVNHAVDAYHKKDYRQVGFWVGKAMDTIFMGDKNKLRQTMVDHINSQNLGWKAELPEQFKDQTLAQLSSRLIPLSMMDSTRFADLTIMDYEGSVTDIPDHFDSREQWPGCVHGIRDQGHCGSCWAFAASESLSDRFCIASDKKVNNVLSPQYLVSCDNILDHGCNGGNPIVSWKFIEFKGLVTDECLPYQSGGGKNPVRCRDFDTCADGSEPVKYRAKKGSTVLHPNPTSIQNSILKHGPVEGAFEVFEDFKAYKGGIYKHTSGSLLGGHAVKIIGWGEEDDTKYWIVANSWTENWGEKGFFRIAFGECGIDRQAVAGQADTDGVNNSVNQSKVEWYF